jgi:hypothetical protein
MNISTLQERLVEAGITLASIDVDNYGQVVIYTGLAVATDGTLVPFDDA